MAEFVNFEAAEDNVDDIIDINEARKCTKM